MKELSCCITFFVSYLYQIYKVGGHGIMAKVLDSGPKVSESEVQLLHYYTHFLTNTIKKVMNSLIHLAMD